jgi:hypothetical protein|tara:strand:+ start:8218 stop:9048 length:831 start_codon:yes stop_codon:yes gene_type:complete
MKAVFNRSDSPVFNGLCSSLECCSDIETLIWDSATKPIMDMFDETKLDILFCEGNISPRELHIARTHYPNVAVVLMADSDLQQFGPNLVLTFDEIKDFPTVRPSVCANVAQLNRGTKREKLASEVAIFSDRLEIDARVGAIIDFVCNSYKTKVFGATKIQVPNYLGMIDNNMKADAICSSKVVLDLGQETWKDTCSLGAVPLVLSEEDIPNIGTFTDIASLKKEIDKALAEDKDTGVLKMMVYNKTYFDLASEILSFFGANQYVEELQKIKGALLS